MIELYYMEFILKLKKGYYPYSLEGKCETRLNELKKYIIKKEIVLDDWSVRHGKYVSFGKYTYLDDWHTLKLGEFWSEAGETAFLKKSIVLENIQNEYIGLNLKTKGEGLLYVNGKPFHGADDYRGYITLTSKADKNESFDLLLEHKAGGYEAFEKTNEKYIFSEASIIFIDKETESAFYDYYVPFDTALHLNDSIIQKLTLNLIYDSLLSIDFSLPPNEVRKQILTENSVYKKKLKTLPKGPGQVYFIGNSHIDLVFMWPEKETHRKVGRTFNTLCRLMNEYTDYHFVCGQVPIFEYIKKYYPDTYKNIKKLIKENRFEPVGGTFVQNDTNLISGESHIRQCLYGQQFFEKEFGKKAEIGWLPDTFGFTYSLPQIYRQAGLKYLFTQKIRYNESNNFIEEDNIPELCFNWEGTDGSKILLYNSGSYKHLTYDYMDYMMYNIDYYYNKISHLPIPDYLAPYGYGDGGGGPSRKALEYIKRLDDTPGFPKVKTGSVQNFFENMPKNRLTDYNNEIYLEAHRGTYTTQSQIKKNNRKAEISIRNAEILSVFANISNKEKLTEIWKKILFNQFHDILPGSCINEGVKDAHKSGRQILNESEKINKSNLEILAHKYNTEGPGKPVFVFNTLSFKRKETVNIICDKNSSVFDRNGKEIPSQYSDGKLSFDAHADAFSGNVYYIQEKTESEKENFSSHIFFNGSSVETCYYNIEIGSDGYISKIYDKENKRDILNGRGNVFEVFEDRPEKFDAWDIESDFECHKKEFICSEKPYLCEKGPIKAVFRSKYIYNNSAIEQDMILYSNSKRIDFKTKAEWHEEHILLKTAFELNIRSNEATYEIPYGSIRRTVNRGDRIEKTKFEVSGHRWADLSENDYGVSLLNDCKYGWDIKKNKMRLSLLRSPKSPDRYADIGSHEFTYSLFPHNSNMLKDTLEQAHSLNNPLFVTYTDSHSGKEIKSFVRTDSNIIIDCIKEAENSQNIILRLYEPYGNRNSCKLEFYKDLKNVKEVNILEEEIGDCTYKDNRLYFNIKPFEIKSFSISI